MKEIKIKVEGMVCSGCENRVKNVLSALPDVKEVMADHTTGIVKVILSGDVSKDTIKNKIEEIGFEISKDN